MDAQTTLAIETVLAARKTLPDRAAMLLLRGARLMDAYRHDEAAEALGECIATVEAFRVEVNVPDAYAHVRASAILEATKLGSGFLKRVIQIAARLDDKRREAVTE
jgi:Ran GTPase-activating protein (RanGAP) involved in mRNA processing and transport